ncbi:MAG: hypothetical protein K6C11_03050 [Bacilli bacterium]|nr:hypothetical protein [Bacilli bacterium]
MGKKEVMLSAFNYLSSDLLYGAYLNTTVKSYLERKCDEIIKDNWTPDMAAFKIREAMKDKETGEPLYIPASELATNPLGSIIGASQADKERYVKEFISKLPYKGNIKTGPDTSINIEEELMSLISKMQDDYTITNPHTGASKSLKDYYRILLSNEFVPLTRMDKIELIMFVKRELIEAYDSFDEEMFQKIALEAVDLMDDKMEITKDGQTFQAADFVNNEYRKSSIDLYNSVNSKPTNVETINLQYDEHNKLFATNEYIFMSDEESSNLSSALADTKDLSDREVLHQTILDILNGIRIAKSMETLSSYYQKITKVREQMTTSFSNDQFLTKLYSTLLSEYANKEDELDVYEANKDDSEILLRNELQEIKDTVKSVRMDYLHTYEDVDDKLEEAKAQFLMFRDKVEEMGLSMHHELDEVSNLIKQVEITTQYSKDNISHTAKRNKAELDLLKAEILSNQRELSYATTPIEQATVDIKLQNSIQDFTKKLEEYLKNGSISNDKYEEYLNSIDIQTREENIQRR